MGYSVAGLFNEENKKENWREQESNGDEFHDVIRWRVIVRRVCRVESLKAFLPLAIDICIYFHFYQLYILKNAKILPFGVVLVFK